MATELRRITVEEVRAAMENTGAKLVRGLTASKTGSTICGCPIGIVAICSGAEFDQGVWMTLGHAEESLNIDESYSSGFVAAFDKIRKDELADGEHYGEHYEEGYADGQAVAAALLPPEPTPATPER